MTTTTLVHSLVSDYVDAWNAHDPVRCAQCFTEDAVREWKVLPLPLTGGKARFEGNVAVEESIRVFMDAVPDLTVTALGRAEGEAHVVLEWLVKGTHTRDWGGWTAQNETVELPGVSIYMFEGGLFHEERMYFDNNLMAANWKPAAA